MFSAIQKKISLILIASMAISWFGFADLASQTALAATGDSVTVALKSVDNSKYITTDTSDNSLYANKTNPWVTDLFDLVEQGDSVYALKSRANGKYVTVGSGRKDTLKATSQTINDDQKFKMITNADATVSFKPVGSLKNYYMSVSSDTNNPINAEQSMPIKFQLSYFDLTKPLKILEIKDLDKPASGDASAVISDLASKLGTNSGYTLETMSIKKFVALRDELDGKYDAIYFGKSLFNPTSETGANHNTRYLENDITTLKAAEITDKYINKGLPVIVYSDSTTKRGALYQGYLNGSTWTKSSGNLYNLFNPYNTTPKSNVIFVSETDINNATTFINKTNLLVNANVRPQLNLTSKPADYTLTANRDSKYKAGDTLTYTFNVSNVRNIGQRNLVANLYLGIDSVLKFDASNLVQTIPVTSLTNNTLSFTLPKGYSGLYYWRLELVDQTSTGKLKDSAAGVFRYQDQPPTIKVLQVIPDSQSVNKTSSLLLESNLKQNYLHSDDYDINISVIDFNTFNSTEYKTLNSKYDMLIFGFNDSYNQTANISSTAAAAVKSFIATGQGVMFTHDTVYQGNTTWINYFQTDTGQIGPMTNMGLNAPNTSTSTVKINEGLLTEFPFFISELPTAVATTHDQYFRLDLNDPKVIPWYNINGSVRDVEDSWNHYYTYSKGNVTYSGTGHNFVNTTKNSSFPDWEQKLFVNTMYRAFIGSNHKPTLDIISPVPFNETAKNYISANSAISVSFKPDDLDLNDKKVTSSITFKYKDKSGTNQTVKVMGDTETNKGETITKTFANPLAESGGDLTISVSTKDAAGALETKEVAVKVITSTGLTPDRTISAEKVEVNNPVTVSYAINPTAKAYSAATNISDLTITGLQFKETFPANMDLVTFPPDFTKTGSLTSGFTLEGNIANIPYRQEGNQFVANSSTFTIVVKPTKAGDYSLSNANLKYKDFASSDQSVLFSNKVVTAFKKITSFSLDNLTIAKGDTSKLIPKVLPIDATYQKNEDFTWSTSASSIVSVDASGQIQGVNAGTATITATAKDGSGLQATSVVSVIQPGLNITGPTQVAVGSTINLMAALVTVNENVTSVSWSSSNPSKANFTVNDQFTGVLRGVQKGTVTVTATVVTDKGKTYTKDYDVKVYTPITSINLNNSSIRVGESVKLNAAYAPSDADYPTFTWSSDRPEVVTVDSNGNITGVSAGTAKITINSTDGSNLSANATVTAVKPSLSVSGPVSVNIGEKITLEALFTTINENVSSVSWSSPDQDKASFATDGDYKRVLTGVKAGTVNGSVTISTDKGNTYTKTFSVSVTTVPVASVNIENATIRVNETTALTTTVLPANASNKTLTWSSNRPEIATVDSSGSIRGVAAGQTTITATTTDGTNKSSNTAVVTVIKPAFTIEGSDIVFVGGSPITLTAKLTTANETVSTYTWHVSDEDKLKARFVTDGADKRVLTGLRSGSINGSVTVVTDKGNTYEQTFSVTVISLLTSLNISGKEIRVGEPNVTITPSFQPLDVSNKTFTWSSGNPAIATVDPNGLLDGRSPGEAMITIRSNDGTNIASTAIVKVIKPSIQITAPATANIKEPFDLSAAFTTVNESKTSVDWKFDEADKVTVSRTDDYNLKATGKSAGTLHGSITITTDKNNTYTEPFTIELKSIPVTSVSIDNTKIRVNEEYQLTPTIKPTEASNKELTWVSNKPEVVTVDQSGNIRGVAPGEATITATTTDGTNISNKAVVTVIKPAFTIEGSDIVFVGGSPITLTAKLSTVNETASSYTWHVSDEDKLKARFVTDGADKRVLTGLRSGSINGSVTVVTDKGNTYEQTFSVTVISLLTSLNISGKEIRVGEPNVTITPSFQPLDVSNKTFTWSSGNPAIATVDPNGLLDGRSPGEAMITIRSNDGTNIASTAIVKVIKPSIQITAPATANIKEPFDLSAAFTTVNESKTSVDWKFDEADKVTVSRTDDYNLKATGKSAGTLHGSITITTDKNNTYTEPFAIELKSIPVTGVSIDNTEIRVNEEYQLTPTIKPTEASNKELTWVSNKPEVVTVDQSGNIRGVAPGEATITATTTDGTNISATATITVIRPSITVDGPNKLYIGGQTITLNVTLHSAHELPSYTTWLVSDEDKLKADFAGVQGSPQRVLTGKQYGTISGTVHMDTDQKGSYDASFQVTVISLQLDDQTVDVGQTGSLSHSINPPVDLTSDIIWKSTNPNVLTVDKVSGNYDAKSEGTSQVTIISKVDQSIIASATVTVAQPRVAIDGDQVVNINGTTTLTASLKSSHQHAKTFTWALDNPNQTFANVTKPSEDARKFNGKNVGLVTGTVTIVTDKNITYSQNFSVSVESLSIVKLTNDVESSPAVITLDKGESIVLKAALNPATALNKEFKWTLTGGTGEAEFIGSDSKGTVTLKGTKKGTIQIQVDTAGGQGYPSKTAAKSAEVKQDLTKLELPKATITLYTKGTEAQKSFDLFKYLTVTPEKVAPEKWKKEWIYDLKAQLQWKSSKANIADVNSDGVVTGLKQGSTTITVTNKDDENVKGEVNVQVIEFDDRY